VKKILQKMGKAPNLVQMNFDPFLKIIYGGKNPKWSPFVLKISKTLVFY
jgi:hypothetical protein